MSKKEKFRDFHIMRDEKHQNIQVVGGAKPLTYEEISELGNKLGLTNFKSKDVSIMGIASNFHHYILSVGEKSPQWNNSPVTFNKQ